MTISKAELARRLGISRQRISQLIAEGLPVKNGGKLDLSEALAWINRHTSKDSKLYQAAQLLGFGEPTRAEDLSSEVSSGVKSAADLSSEVSSSVKSADAFLDNLLRGQFADKAEAEMIKENALAGLRTLELRRKAGTVVDLEEAKNLFFTTARAERDAWMNWPARIGPRFAAAFNLPADKVTDALQQYVYDELVQRSDPEFVINE